VKLIGLVDSHDHVCCRYRLAAFRPALTAAGHSLDLVALPETTLARLRLFCTLAKYDAVVLQRRLMARVSVALLRRYAKRLIFDFDDAVWLRDSYHAKGPHSPKRLRRFAATCDAADLVVAGNDFLAEKAGAYAPGRVVTIPTCVDQSKYRPAPHDGDTVSLVWVGSASTLQSLAAIRDTLDAVGAAVPGVRLKLICDTPLTLGRLPVDFVPWDGATEAGHLADSAAGIATMPDDDWSRGKCGLKVLQYLAAGLPVVANRVGVHSKMLRNGENGFLADTADEWVSAVRRLAGDRELRKIMGTAGRGFEQFEYGVAEGGRRWLAALDGLAEGHADDARRRAG
jgi:glycosyltransferase involved in cell wall biosynthesis